MSQTPHLDRLFQRWQADKTSVPLAWQIFFAKQQGEALPSPQYHEDANDSAALSACHLKSAQNQMTELINAFRAHGHKGAQVNPLFPKEKIEAELDTASYGITDHMLEQVFDSNGVLPVDAKLDNILKNLEMTYCRSIGVQYVHVDSQDERKWLQNRMEEVQNAPKRSSQKKEKIAEALMQTEAFEQFLHKKYVGVKRFSIEGAESLIPMLRHMLEDCARTGVVDVVLGMAHRGRLNVLANIMDKPLQEIFAEFNDTLVYEDGDSTNDVKYHMGKSYDVQTHSGQKVHISLQYNPSHLEMVNPVVAGSARARIKSYGGDSTKVLPVMIHGDAAFAGQGVVPETLNLANLEGYTVGGAVHVVINNQVGFTAEPQETFSGQYCTDIAKMLHVPIFHVNGDDPEACVWVMELAMAYRKQFKKDVVIDLVCYRKYGHNEGDDPSFTQPLMYRLIKNHPSVCSQYQEKIMEDGVLQDTIESAEKDYVNRLQQAFDAAKNPLVVTPEDCQGGWQGFCATEDSVPKTAISKAKLKALANAMVSFPAGFTPNSKVAKTLEKRAEMLAGKALLDWGAAEVAAYGSLLADGVSVRISGQDVQRGTFSHRHIVNVDADTGNRIAPVAAMAKNGATLEVHNSALSELAVLGFEYGHSLADPKCLTIWEAQFGDFANGAQVMIDQFIASGETKWQRMSGLTMLLPHGYEGMGPEHSSARLERYLQLCAQNNITVAHPTTPAQMFHLLRWQILRTYRKPLVVMTPKSLLRHPLATSTASELTTGAFQEVLADDPAIMAKAKKVVLCSGKIYYDLLARRSDLKTEDVALIRLEQLYPVPLQQVQQMLAQCTVAEEFFWVQEDPRNQGAWGFLLDTLFMDLEQPFYYIGRMAMASPAVGSAKRHKEELEAILTEVFEG